MVAPEHVLDVLSVGGVCSVDNTRLHNAVIIRASTLNTCSFIKSQIYDNTHLDNPDVNRPVLVGLALELQEVSRPDIAVIIIINTSDVITVMRVIINKQDDLFHIQNKIHIIEVFQFMRVIIMMIYLARISSAAWSVPSSYHSEISPTLYLEHIKSLSS